MTVQDQTMPRALAVWFKDLHRWDYGFFRTLTWAWSADLLFPVGTVLERKQVEVSASEAKDKATLPIIEKISFGGQVSVTDTKSRGNYKGRLFWAASGNLIYSKIRVKQGSLAVVPDELDRLAVSAEYPVYDIKKEFVNPVFLTLVLKSRSFLSLFEGLSHGGSTKTRIPPAEFERQLIPLPKIVEQTAIVSHWRKAQDDIAAARGRVGKMEAALPQIVYQGLGTPPPATEQPTGKCLIVWWKDLERWSFNHVIRSSCGLLGFARSNFPIEPLGNHLVGTMHGFCIKPVAGPTSHKMLKLNALNPAGLDLTASKYVTVPDRIVERFSIKKDDILICRSNAYEYVAKCVLVREDQPAYLFPDIIIRARVKDSLLPEYVAEVIQTPLGRSFFQINSRRAVGGMWKIGAEDIANFPIPVPPLDVQKQIVERIMAARREITRERETADRLARDISAEVEALILGAKS